jgi:hypothetical protein
MRSPLKLLRVALENRDETVFSTGRYKFTVWWQEIP